MKLNLKKIESLLFFSFLFLFLTSCSKDSDLLSEYVIENKDQLSQINRKVVNDIYFIENNSSIVLDVLQNDTFTNINNVHIISTSTPQAGLIVINEDNTLTYTLKEESSTSETIEETIEETVEETVEEIIVDNFTYTAEEINDDGSTTIDEGEITVKFENTIISIENSFWSKNQMQVVKQRLVNGWENNNFPNEVQLLENCKNHFLNNTESTRYLNIDKSTPLGSFSNEYDATRAFSHEPLVNYNPYIDYPFKAAIWGRAFEDKKIADVLLNELIFYTSNPDYDFSNTSKFPRDRRADINPFFIMMAWTGKWHEIYREYVKDYSSINDSQMAQIESWFGSAADWAFHTANVTITPYLGSNWIYSDNSRSQGLANSSSPIIESINGSAILDYKISDFSEAFNNRLWDSIEFVHSYGLHSGNSLYRDMGVTFFKYSLKYHVYPNGIIGEIKRTTLNDASLGLAYCNVILTGMTRLAHAEESARRSGLIQKNGWNSEYLYDYETSDGHITGQEYDGIIYNGGSTTNGNMKSLKLALTTTSKFYRSAENGGFVNKFYYGGVEISGENRKYPAVFGMANSYYNDNFLYEHSMMDTNAGLPVGSMDPQNGFGPGVMAWGKGLSPILWIDMENKIFN